VACGPKAPYANANAKANAYAKEHVNGYANETVLANATAIAIAKGTLSLAERALYGRGNAGVRAELIVLAKRRLVEFLNDHPANELLSRYVVCRCGRVFAVDRDDQAHCSERCRLADFRNEKGRETGSRVSDGRTPRNVAFSGALTSTNAGTFRTRETLCEGCGKIFEAKVGGRPAKFCSDRCRMRVRRRDARAEAASGRQATPPTGQR
jgi:hypothetical protein